MYLILRRLAGKSPSAKYDRLLLTSIGLGLTNTAGYHAQRLCHIHMEELEIEAHLANLTGEDGKPLVIYRKGRISSQTTKRYLSRRRFDKALGIAPTHDSSGHNQSRQIVGGSDLCRIVLWQWIFVRLAVKHNRPRTNIVTILADYLDR